MSNAVILLAHVASSVECGPYSNQPARAPCWTIWVVCFLDICTYDIPKRLGCHRFERMEIEGYFDSGVMASSRPISISYRLALGVSPVLGAWGLGVSPGISVEYQSQIEPHCEE